MTRWLRRSFRRLGMDVPFNRVVCPEELKTIAIDLQWRATVTVRRQMVFLEQPIEGDLRDIVPVLPGGTDSRLLDSADSKDIARRSLAAHTRIYWMPREPITEYAIYTHERSWVMPAQDVKDVLCTELACSHRLATMKIEIIAPVAYETSVAFRLPWWHRLANERQLMKHALTQMDVSRTRPVIDETRTKVTWQIRRPRVGERFVCIAFTSAGLAAWRQELEDTSLAGRLRRLLRVGRRDHTTARTGRVLLTGE